MPPAILILSGHKSCTHKIDLALKKFEAKIPGIPTVIGEGAKTKTLSNSVFILNNFKVERIANEK
jgi:hypothetical protein